MEKIIHNIYVSNKAVSKLKYIIFNYKGQEDYIYEWDKKIQEIKMNKYNNIYFNFDFTSKSLTLKEADKLIKYIKKINNIFKKYNCNLGIKQGKNIIIASVKYGNSNYEKQVIYSIGTLLFNILEERIDYLYDVICKYLDDIVISNNVCGFQDNKCIAKRDTNCTMGCCHHYKHKYLGILFEKDLHLCEYQKDKKCTAKCITCKMYMCDYIKKNYGIKFTTKNVLLIKRYFNFIQKQVIRYSFFTPKEVIMKRLLIKY